MPGRILKQLTEKALLYVTYMYIAILSFGYFQMQWKVAEIVNLENLLLNKNLVDQLGC